MTESMVGLQQVALVVWMMAPPFFAQAALHKDNSCPLLSLYPFSKTSEKANLALNNDFQAALDRNRLGWSRMSYSFLAAAQLAVEHFNTRNAVIVPALGESYIRECPVFFPWDQFVYDGSGGSDSVQAFLDLGEILEQKTNGTQRYPCAILGPAEEKSSILLTGLTETLGVPQMSFMADSDLLLGSGHSSTIGMVNTMKGRSQRILEYLQSPPLHRNHLAGIYHQSPDSMMLASRLQVTGEEMSTVEVVYMEEPANSPDGILESLKQISQTGIKTIFLNVAWVDQLYQAAEALEELNMLNGDYLYLLPSSFLPPDSVSLMLGQQKVDSPFDKLLCGALLIDRIDPFQVKAETDPFLLVWKGQGADFANKINSMLPLTPENPSYFRGNASFFQELPSHGSSYLYDAVMSIGIGACLQISTEQQQEGDQGDKGEPQNGPQKGPPEGSAPNNDPGDQSTKPQAGQEQPPDDSAPPSSDYHPLNTAILSSTFHGASGFVDFVTTPSRGRNPENTMMGAYNIQPTSVDPDTGLRGYRAVLTSYFDPKTGSWEDTEGTHFIYSNGSTQPPPLGFQILEPNFLNTWVRVLGFLLLALAWLLSVGAAVLVRILKEDSVVKMSQPFFLQLSCFGSAVMTTSILTLSFDESTGWTDSGLDRLCMSTPWFFFFGHVIVFSAMFTKLWRLDRVFQFSRRRVTIQDVMGPICCLNAMCLVILMVWTVTDPWTWNREITSVFPAESYGQCTSDNFALFFGLLMGIMLVAEILTVYFAWKTNDLPMDYRNAIPILQTIAAQIQAWIVGVPILVVLQDSSANATYLGRIFLVWVFAVSSVAFDVWPKILKAIQVRLHPNTGTPKEDRVRITGLNLPEAAVRRKPAVEMPDSQMDPKSVNTKSTLTSNCEGSTVVHEERPNSAELENLAEEYNDQKEGWHETPNT